ncbi:hypothetical protein J6590_099182 [Homalodisca vitripennis]|nr:hypothetical protein J6590_099182 [Homalodisca vitripennis]
MELILEKYSMDEFKSMNESISNSHIVSILNQFSILAVTGSSKVVGSGVVEDLCGRVGSGSAAVTGIRDEFRGLERFNLCRQSINSSARRCLLLFFKCIA